jgi:HEPN domain-containing protein
MNSIEVFINLAKDDLKSAKLLHTEKQFRTSYFFFQQAVEKANKAYGLYNGLIDEKELRNISHDQFKIHKKDIDKQEEEIKKFIANFEVIPFLQNNPLVTKNQTEEYHKKLINGKKFIDSLRNYDLVNFPLSDLSCFLRELKRIENTKIEFTISAYSKFKKGLKKYTDWIMQFENPDLNEANAYLNELFGDELKTKEFISAFFKAFIDGAYIYFTLYYSALITIQHSSLTRYPDFVKDINPLDLYNDKLPIIRKQKQFMELLESTLGKLSVLNAEKP